MDTNQLRTHLAGLRANYEDLKEMESISAPNQRFRDNLESMQSHIEAVDNLLTSGGSISQPSTAAPAPVEHDEHEVEETD